MPPGRREKAVSGFSGWGPATFLTLHQLGACGLDPAIDPALDLFPMAYLGVARDRRDVR
jgi:hypothetical protein